MQRIKIGEMGKAKMPYSEVCMHMQVAGKVMHFKLLSDRAVQLYDDTGTVGVPHLKEFSFPILTGEAGIFQDEEGFYYYESY